MIKSNIFSTFEAIQSFFLAQDYTTYFVLFVNLDKHVPNLEILSKFWTNTTNKSIKKIFNNYSPLELDATVSAFIPPSYENEQKEYV